MGGTLLGFRRWGRAPCRGGVCVTICYDLFTRRRQTPSVCRGVESGVASPWLVVLSSQSSKKRPSPEPIRQQPPMLMRMFFCPACL